MAYTVKQADDMYDEWRRSCSDKDFAEYFGLSPQDLLEISDVYVKSRGEHKHGEGKIP